MTIERDDSDGGNGNGGSNGSDGVLRRRPRQSHRAAASAAVDAAAFDALPRPLKPPVCRSQPPETVGPGLAALRRDVRLGVHVQDRENLWGIVG